MSQSSMLREKFVQVNSNTLFITSLPTLAIDTKCKLLLPILVFKMVGWLPLILGKQYQLGLITAEERKT